METHACQGISPLAARARYTSDPCRADQTRTVRAALCIAPRYLLNWLRGAQVTPYTSSYLGMRACRNALQVPKSLQW